MGFRDWGSAPLNSTGGNNGDGLETNPASTTIIAEITPTQLVGQGVLHQVTFLIGASTNVIWQLEQASSTSLSSGAIRDRTYVQTPSNQTGQYILTYKLEAGDRIRALLQSGITGVATAKISCEPIT